MLRLSLAILLTHATFEAGTTFSGEMGQGHITFTQLITASAIDSDGVKVMFTDFAMGGVAYGTIGFASSIGCSMSVSEASSTAIKYAATVTAALATATVYTPGRGSPTGVTGAQSWSKVGDAVTAVLPTGSHQVTISYVTTATDPGERPSPLTDLIPDLSGVTDFIDDNVILLSAGVIVLYLLNQQPKRRRRRRRARAPKL